MDEQEKSQSPSFSDPEGTLKVVKQAVLELWGVINALTSLRPPKRDRFRVTIFGSARIQPDSPIYKSVTWRRFP
ncbi:hypothetical protein [Crocosphaera sp.]|uniref:hypothetical protein n=1 Tax=Crocosphaera sp. TaxID=2729996 RepID=UPI003F1EFB50|nr:hypothetical protein [Crocosphaera sp.]